MRVRIERNSKRATGDAEVAFRLNDDLPQTGSVGAAIGNGAGPGGSGGVLTTAPRDPTFEKFREFVRHTNRQSLMPDHIRLGADSCDSIDDSGSPQAEVLEGRKVLLSRKDNVFGIKSKTRNVVASHEKKGDSILSEYSAS